MSLGVVGVEFFFVEYWGMFKKYKFICVVIKSYIFIWGLNNKGYYLECFIMLIKVIEVIVVVGFFNVMIFIGLVDILD